MYRSMFCNTNLSLKLILQFLECYIWAILLYGVKTLTIKAQIAKNIEALETWLLDEY